MILLFCIALTTAAVTGENCVMTKSASLTRAISFCSSLVSGGRSGPTTSQPSGSRIAFLNVDFLGAEVGHCYFVLCHESLLLVI